MNYFYKHSLSFLFTLVCLSSTFAQVSYTHYKYQQEPGPTGFIRCSSMEVDMVRRLNNPAMESREQFEEWLAPKVRAYKNQQANPEQRSSTVLQIPVVVHVLHNGEPIGTGPNITDAQVNSQITVLNQDYRKMMNTRGWNDHPDGADVMIEFIMAKTAPDGTATNGINREDIGQDGATRDDLENEIKPNTIWDATKYLNMWTVKFAAPDDNLLGYAQFPESSGLDGMPTSPQSAETDGVVQLYRAFGSEDYDDGTFDLHSSYNLGRTATHEVGHWVGLRHIWGDGLGCNLGAPTPGCSCANDDYCADTPNSEKANYDCDSDNVSSCSNLPDGTVDMDENYMDYTYDYCMNIFTNDQKARVQTVMANSPRRMELPTSPALQNPAPYISFVEKSSEVLEGSSCNTVTVDVDLMIAMAPSADATVSFTLSGDAQNGNWLDYTISPATVTFPSGSTANQTLAITVYKDKEIEFNERVILTIDMVTTSGDAREGFTNQQYELTIKDDDFEPLNSGSLPNTLLYFQDFNAPGNFGGCTVSKSGSSAVDFRVGMPALGMIGDVSAYISRTNIPGDTYTYDHLAESWARLETPSINASNATDLSVNFNYICFGEEDGDTQYDFGTVYYSTNGGTTWKRVGPILVGQLLEANRTIELPSDADRSPNLKIGFRWDNDGLLGTDPPLSVDDIAVRGSAGVPVAVQEAVSPDPGDQQYFGPNATVHFYDPTTKNVMVTLKNNSTYDFGCTEVRVDRSRTSAEASTVPFNNNNPENELAAKTFRIIPTNNAPASGQTYEVTLYYTESEIAGWETETGEFRNNLEIIKVKNNAISDVNSGNAGSFTIDNQAAAVTPYAGTGAKVTTTFADGFSGFGIGIYVATALPIELVDFYGKKEEKEVALNWITANETNNDYFTVERSADGYDFYEIGKVMGAGNSDIELFYDYMDKNPLSGMNYYRLKQTDFDGKFSYSNVLAIEMERPASQARIYPNPASGDVQLDFDSQVVPAQNDIRLYNHLGQTMNISLQQQGDQRMSFSTSHLPNGIYFIQWEHNNAVQTSRLVVQH